MTEQSFTQWYLVRRPALRDEFVSQHDVLPTDPRQRENLWLAWLRKTYEAERAANCASGACGE